jgi:hypothetical protein
MSEKLPEYLSQGERARLFPVLSTTSKEGRTTSIVLACLDKVDEFAVALLSTVGVRVGKRTSIETFTEVVFKNQSAAIKERPDGLIVVRSGSKEWRALVEAKIGSSELKADQVERYRALAKDNSVDCVITLSNQFATSPENHPVDEVRKSRSKVPAFHWSWMHVLTTTDLLINNDAINDADQTLLLNELRRFLTHESAGVRGFDRMPPEWSILNKLVSSGGRIPSKSPDALAVIDAWHQETRDLSLILSRLTETSIHEKLSRKHREDPILRQRDEVVQLRESHRLSVSLDVPDAAAPLEIVADMTRRCIDVGMTLRAPEDKKSSKARVNWLLRQIRTENTAEIFVRLQWPGRSEDTQFSLEQLQADASVVDIDKEHLQVLAFHVFHSRRLGARFAQQVNFIADLETIVPDFYANVGSNLVAWKRRAPKIRPNRQQAEDVSVEALEEEADAFPADETE